MYEDWLQMWECLGNCIAFPGMRRSYFMMTRGLV